MTELLAPYVVEKMHLSDVPAVAELEKQVFTLPWSAHAFDYELRYNRTAHFLVARPAPPSGEVNDRAIVGFTGFWHIVDEVHICTLAVHPAHRQRGLASLLLLAVMDQARELQAEVATLEVRISNETAIRLYERFGFRIVGRRKAYYSDNREDAYIMTADSLSLPESINRLKRIRTLMLERMSASRNAGQMMI